MVVLFFFSFPREETLREAKPIIVVLFSMKEGL